MTPPAFAAEPGCRRTSHRSISVVDARAHSAANQPHAAAAVDRRDRQTNGRTDTRADTRPLYRPCSAHRNMQAASKITYMLTYLRNTELRDAWEAWSIGRSLYIAEMSDADTQRRRRHLTHLAALSQGRWLQQQQQRSASNSQHLSQSLAS